MIFIANDILQLFCRDCMQQEKKCLLVASIVPGSWLE